MFADFLLFVRQGTKAKQIEVTDKYEVNNLSFCESAIRSYNNVK